MPSHTAFSAVIVQSGLEFTVTTFWQVLTHALASVTSRSIVPVSGTVAV